MEVCARQELLFVPDVSDGAGGRGGCDRAVAGEARVWTRAAVVAVIVLAALSPAAVGDVDAASGTANWRI